MKQLNININGNKKLVNNDTTRFIIWNLPAIKTCPFATESCKKACYARKAEKVYPTVLPCRENNYKDSLQAEFVENMIFTIEKEIAKKKYNGKQIVFRIHESGDFYNYEYTEKWIDICKHFENNKNLVFLAYTKSITYILNCGYGLHMFPKNLVIRSSIWNDTAQDKIELTKYFSIPVYTALPTAQIENMKKENVCFGHCRCNDCATCGECWNGTYKRIICDIH